MTQFREQNDTNTLHQLIRNAGFSGMQAVGPAARPDTDCFHKREARIDKERCSQYPTERRKTKIYPKNQIQ